MSKPLVVAIDAMGGDSGPDLTVPVKDGELVLGTWQQIFHLDCDNKAHRRRVQVTVIGE